MQGRREIYCLTVSHQCVQTVMKIPKGLVKTVKKRLLVFIPGMSRILTEEN